VDDNVDIHEVKVWSLAALVVRGQGGGELKIGCPVAPMAKALTNEESASWASEAKAEASSRASAPQGA